ncbi:short-chain dehydrogenase [Desarmillaria tabescens]|uniref:Short-chain dehydrogenase n=1 Tax=Armillaria tabescens TaxID=1929756 RepID=A0AA39MU01_ARMTA|nr:short-chain dehydrogenase [Desarmillaria tabescens]KAK0446567.1 short-chain dehydrogenase [Desarmillaria tabescens]
MDLNMATVMSLSGRVGLVTGGGTGIGFIIAKAFAANGAKVYITGRRLNVLEEAAASVTGIPGSLVPLQMDVTDEESIKAGAKHIEEIDGKLNILVNKFVCGYLHSSRSYTDAFLAPDAHGSRDPDLIARYATEDPLELETVQNWADIFALNAIAPFFVIRAFQSLLVKGAQSRPHSTSSVINISSVSVKMNMTSSVASIAYGPTKAALDKLTLVLATSFAARGIPIRVNVLAPGAFMSEQLNDEFLEKSVPGLVKTIPAKRLGSDAEMGMTAVYLAVSDYTNGAVLRVDGGLALVIP